jgi:hypothetical protein
VETIVGQRIKALVDGEIVPLTEAVAGLVVAVETGDRLRLIGELNLLLVALTEHGEIGFGPHPGRQDRF